MLRALTLLLTAVAAGASASATSSPRDAGPPAARGFFDKKPKAVTKIKCVSTYPGSASGGVRGDVTFVSKASSSGGFSFANSFKSGQSLVTDISVNLDLSAADVTDDCLDANGQFSGFQLHLHEKWGESGSSASGAEGCSATGKHYDPTLACGGAGNPLCVDSRWPKGCSPSGTVCVTSIEPDEYVCSPSTYETPYQLRTTTTTGGANAYNRATCQVGDLNNKFGTEVTGLGVKALFKLDRNGRFKGRFSDYFSVPTSIFPTTWSTVLHCATGAKFACAQMVCTPQY